MELFRTLAALVEPPGDHTPRLAAALDLPEVPTADQHAELFGLQFVPYASVYLGPEGMIGGDARDRIAGFWRALGETPPAEPDHLAVMLAFYASLAELEAETAAADRREALGRARVAWLHEHLVSWLPVWLASVREIASPPYGRWAGILWQAVEEEASERPLPDLPLHLREAPPLADPRVEGAEAFVTALLAPVRSGLLLARADLGRAAAALGLGLRLGERRYVLRALLAQDAGAVLDWLGREAERQAARHTAAPFGTTTTFWASRATASARLLNELKETAPGVN
jgi:TorA maturation chaperone TorD